jgi:hypothetical protein
LIYLQIRYSLPICPLLLSYTNSGRIQRSLALNLLHSQGMFDCDYRELVSRLSTSLAMVEAAYMEVRG